ncbi:MAG: nucleoside hydrolase, partial [Anaerolineaceae bacterium]|nr:nucleoside hydrolase [Anaerolineaceae bacterium]
PKAIFFQKINVHITTFIKEHYRSDGMFAPDGLAMAAALEPSIIIKKEVRHLSVELSGNQTRGMTVVDWLGRGGKAPNAEIILEINYPRFADLMANGLK